MDYTPKLPRTIMSKEFANADAIAEALQSFEFGDDVTLVPYGLHRNDSPDRSLEKAPMANFQPISESPMQDSSSSWHSSISLLRHHFENGRRYHGYREGRYFFPNDEKEQERLDLYHHVTLLRLDDHLYLSPIGESPERIMDIGTGTGIWAIDVANKLTNTQVIGTDLSSMQPPVGLGNLVFEIDDAESEWVYPENHFDFIHGRCLAGGIDDWPKLLAQSYRHVKPGGWAEFHDLVPDCLTDDGSLPYDSALSRWCRTISDAAKSIGKSWNVCPVLKAYMEAAGFTNVQEVRLKVPLNSWPKDRRMREMGKLMLLSMLEGLEGMTLALFTRVLGWTPGSVKELLEEVAKDFGNRKHHIYTYCTIVYGQKPTN